MEHWDKLICSHLFHIECTSVSGLRLHYSEVVLIFSDPMLALFSAALHPISFRLGTRPIVKQRSFQVIKSEIKQTLCSLISILLLEASCFTLPLPPSIPNLLGSLTLLCET